MFTQPSVTCEANRTGQARVESGAGAAAELTVKWIPMVSCCRWMRSMMSSSR